MAPLPVTVLSGFLGSGKTTLLNYVLNQKHGKRIAVIVNDMSEVNVDAGLVRSQEKLVSMSNGCICCTLRDDLLKEVAGLAREGRFDYLLIEGSGISEPLPVAMTFSFEDETGIKLGDIAKLDTLVSVVDVSRLESLISTKDRLGQMEEEAAPEDDRPLSRLMVDQIEFANVVLLNKIDLVEPEVADRAEAIVKTLNPRARVVRTTKSAVDLDLILNTGLYDEEAMMADPAWEEDMSKVHTPETEEYGISSHVFRSRLPFHPERFLEWIKLKKDGLLRMKGLAWIASEPDWAWNVQSAGPHAEVMPAGTWWASASPEDWPADPADQEAIKKDWQEPWGDRRQELVLIGLGDNWKDWTEGLHSCVLQPEEVEKGPKAWMRWKTVFKVERSA